MNRTSRISRRHFLARAATAVAALGATPLLNAARAAGTAWDNNLELAVNFEINQPSGGRYNRPYVAVWLEDASGNPVRTLSLWVESGRCSRWIPELQRWYRENSTLVNTVSGPTRNPGKYSLVWDGKNDKKQTVNQGDYYICIESAREHGPYQLIREKVTLGTKTFTSAVTGNDEIKGVSLEYRKAK